ncbi:MAG: ergothioneine biosynthesis protein EgtB [Nevskiales bacterium]|nr:ergothioneine biosynthesis protein EgtB [Nevskiales bacterium]
MMHHAQEYPGAAVSGALLTHFHDVRQRSLNLIRDLSAEDCQVQSMPDASPAKWHLAHTTWFFETFVLAACGVDYEPFHPRYGFLFNSYYNSVGRMHPRPLRGLLTRPGLSEILAYRAHVDAQVERHFDAIRDRQLLPRVELGLQHEQQHQELILTDILHALSCNPLAPAYRDGSPPASQERPLSWQRFEAGLRMIGAEGEGFSFDNESPRHRVWLDAFELASRPVTNAEYAAFIRDGGYEQPLWWLSDGWAEREAQGWRAPMYWSEDARDVFTPYGMRPLDPHAPVCHLSYYEADAYARWYGARLPTEAEWEVAMADRWAPPPGEAQALVPVLTDAGTAEGAGQVWEWTASAYDAYPGFAPSAGAIGEYNGKFMCNQFVLRGGSCASPPGHARLSYRNFFAPACRWQFSGLRLARNAERAGDPA